MSPFFLKGSLLLYHHLSSSTTSSAPPIPCASQYNITCNQEITQATLKHSGKITLIPRNKVVQ